MILGLIVLAGLGLRVVYVLTVTHDDPHLYDASYYAAQARSIAQGMGFFVDPSHRFKDPDGSPGPAADHPPLTSTVLVPAALVDDAHARDLLMRFTMVGVGLATIALVGALGRAIGGDTTGLLAAGIAALDPNLWMNDGLIMSESLSVMLTAAILVCAYRVMTRGVSWRWIVAMGCSCGLLMLTRSELALMTPFVAVPAVWIGSRGTRELRVRALWALSAAAVTALVVGPWVAYNLSRFHDPTTISSNDGFALLAGNCASVYDGPFIGLIDINCVPAPRGDQSEANSRDESRALSFIEHHLDRVPVVMLARVGRMWSVYAFDQGTTAGELEGRPRWASAMGRVFLFVLLPLAIVGGVMLRRRRIPLWPLVVPVALVTITVALWTGGFIRYRAPAEPSIIALASVGALALAARLRPA